MNPYEPSDSRYDLWPTHDVTVSDRPQRYAEYLRAQHRRGYVFDLLNEMKINRERYAYWRKRDVSIAFMARDVFYGILDDVREMAGPALPGMERKSHRYLEAAE
jgi:hypothetical protein